LATPPEKKAPSLDPIIVARRLEREPWACKKAKDFAKHSTWYTQHGFYFSVPHDCTQADLDAILEDLRKHGRKRNV